MAWPEEADRCDVEMNGHIWQPLSTWAAGGVCVMCACANPSTASRIGCKTPSRPTPGNRVA